MTFLIWYKKSANAIIHTCSIAFKSGLSPIHSTGRILCHRGELLHFMEWFKKFEYNTELKKIGLTTLEKGVQWVTLTFDLACR